MLSWWKFTSQHSTQAAISQNTLAGEKGNNHKHSWISRSIFRDSLVREAPMFSTGFKNVAQSSSAFRLPSLPTACEARHNGQLGVCGLGFRPMSSFSGCRSSASTVGWIARALGKDQRTHRSRVEGQTRPVADKPTEATTFNDLIGTKPVLESPSAPRGGGAMVSYPHLEATPVWTCFSAILQRT